MGGLVYIICRYSFIQPPNCLESRVLLSYNKVYYTVTIIANAMNRNVWQDGLFRSRNRRETAGTCWTWWQTETIFFSQDLRAAVLTPSFPQAELKSIHIFYYTRQSFCLILFNTASVKALFYSTDFISERRKKTDNAQEGVEHLLDHISEQEPLAILSVGEASFLVHYLTLEMTASAHGAMWNNYCQLPDIFFWWGQLTLLLSSLWNLNYTPHFF